MAHAALSEALLVLSNSYLNVSGMQASRADHESRTAAWVADHAAGPQSRLSVVIPALVGASKPTCNVASNNVYMTSRAAIRRTKPLASGQLSPGSALHLANLWQTADQRPVKQSVPAPRSVRQGAVPGSSPDIIVVDGGSTDATASEARQAGAQVASSSIQLLHPWSVLPHHRGSPTALMP